MKFPKRRGRGVTVLLTPSCGWLDYTRIPLEYCARAKNGGGFYLFGLMFCGHHYARAVEGRALGKARWWQAGEQAGSSVAETVVR